MIYKKLVLQGKQKVWFTSDLHFSHENICKGTTKWDLRGSDIHSSTRDFENPEQMNSHLIENINKYVKEDDWLIHLGDWSFKNADEIYNNRIRIVCKNIVHILGNHCNKIANNVTLSNGVKAQDVFESVHPYLELSVSSSVYGKQSYNLFHFPLSIWNKGHHGRIHLFGHVHGSNAGEGRMLDVGVDNAFKLFGEYRPFSQEDINKYIEDKEFVQKSHHNKNTN